MEGLTTAAAKPPETADVRARVTAALAELAAPADGKDPADAVADRLRALDITGWRGSESMCPVALYLARVDEAWTAEVLEAAVYVEVDELAPMVEVALPESVSWFVQRFDRDVYLDLADGQVA